MACRMGGAWIRLRDVLPIWRISVEMKTYTDQDASWTQKYKLKKLTLEQVKHIDEVLASLGDYGEVHLVIQNGELRYINRVESFSARKGDIKE